MNATESIAVFLQAVAGFRPIGDDIQERMHGFTQICRGHVRARQNKIGGSTVGRRAIGDLELIGQQHFGLNKSQQRVCLSRAKEFMRELSSQSKTSSEAVAEVLERWQQLEQQKAA